MPLEKGRRSSILKPSKARNPLGELDQLRPSENNEDDGATTTETIRNRRVSFSHKKGVALFTSEEGNTIWHNIYEEHNKPDLSDSGGSHLHISVDDDNLNIKQEQNKLNHTLPIFNTNNEDHVDDDEDEHCVDIQAMLSGFKRPVDNKATPNLVLELTQPSITEQTDILINYKIPHEDEPLSYIKSEEVKIKVESEGDILFNESQAEMSITQDLPVIIVTNETNKVNKIKKAPFDISMVEDKSKWSEDKENIVIQGCSYNIEEQVKVEVEEHLCIKEEYHNIKNESLHIEDFYSFGAKRPIADTNERDVPDKKIKSESDVILNTVKNEVYTNDLVREEDVSMTYCFTKEIKMNNKRETIGYNVKELDMSLTCPDYIEMDPLADIKTPIDLPIKSKGPSDLDDSIDHGVQDKNFEFVECNNFNDSRNVDDLDKSDFLKINQENEDCKVNIVRRADQLGTSPILSNENDCNTSMSDIVSAMTQSLDRGEYTNKKLGPQTAPKCNDIISHENVNYGKEQNVCLSSGEGEKPKSDSAKPVKVPVIDERTKTALDSEISDFYMSCSVPIRPNVRSDCRNTGTLTPFQKDQDNLKSNIEKDSNVTNYICDVTMKTAEIIPIDNQIHVNEDKSKNLQHVNNKSKLDAPVKIITSKDSKDDKRVTNFNYNVPENNVAMREIMTKQITSVSNTLLPEISKEMTNTRTDIINSNIPTDKRRTIHFNENVPEFDMSMTSVAPIQTVTDDNTNKRRTIHFNENMPEFDMSMTSVAPVQTVTDDKTNKRRTIHFNENMPEFDMSMTSVAPVQTLTDDNTNKRRTIHFNENMPEFDMSMTSVAPIQTVTDDNTNKRRTIHFNENMPEFDMSMTSVAPIQTLTDDNTNKRRTIHFNENMPEFDMSMTSVAPIQTVPNDNTNKRRTIHFNANMPESDMSMTSVAPVQTVTEDNTNKRRTIHFNENMPEFDMSMTSVAPIQTLTDDNTNKRRTIHFNENMPEFDMSMTSVAPIQTVPNDNTNKRRTIHFNANMPESDMSMTSVAPVQTVTDDNTNKRRTIQPEFDMSLTGVAPIQAKLVNNANNENMPELDMSITGVVPMQNTKDVDNKNKENMPKFDMSLTCGAPMQIKPDDNTNKRRTIHFNEDMPEFDMSMTGVAPIQAKLVNNANNEDIPELDMSITGVVPMQNTKDVDNKNKENMPKLDMSLTCGAPMQIKPDDNTNKRRTIHFNEDMPEFDMSMTGVAPIQAKLVNNANNEDIPELDMSITGVVPMQNTKDVDNKNKENMPKFDMSLTCGAPMQIKPDDNTNKRRTIHFNEDMPEFDMSMTGVAPIQAKLVNNANNEDIPELDMSIKGVVPMQNTKDVDNKNKENMPKLDMSLTCGAPMQIKPDDNTNKRRTIHFNEDMPEFDMSMTGVAPIQAKLVNNANNEDIPELDMSITGVVPMQNTKDVDNKNKENMPKFDMSLTCGAPMQIKPDDNTNKRRTIHFNEDMPEFDMSMTGVAPIQAKLVNNANNEDIPELDMSITGVVPMQNTKDVDNKNKENMPKLDMSLTCGAPMQIKPDDNTNKRRTIHFNEDMPEFDMSMTGIAPIQAKLVNNANKKDMPEIDFSITGVVPIQTVTNDNTNKRRTIHFNEKMLEFDMSMIGIVPIKAKPVDNANNEDIPEIDMSITGVVPIQTITNENTNKRRTIHFNEKMLELDMSMTGIVPIKAKPVDNANNEDIPEIDMSVTGVFPLQSKTIDITNNKNNTPEFDMSMTGVVPINLKEDDISNKKTLLLTKATGEDALSFKNNNAAPRILNDNTNEKSSSCKQDGLTTTTSPIGMVRLNNKEDVFVFRKSSSSKNDEKSENNSNISQNHTKDAVYIGFHESNERMSMQINLKNANNENVQTTSKFKETSEFNVSDKNDTFKSPMDRIDNQNNCLKENNSDKANGKEQMAYPCNSFVKNELAKLQSSDNNIHNVSYGNHCRNSEISNKAQDLVETSKDKTTNNLKESSDYQYKIDKKIPMNTHCQNVSLNRDNAESVHENYFEQGCADLLHNSKLVNESYMSVSGIAPRIPPKMNSFNCTFNNVSYFNPNIDESKSVLFSKNYAPEKIMEISKCYEGYRDPCKSANNSIFGADKSNLSLPNIDESDMDFQVMNESTSEVMQMENKLNITSDNSASINDKSSSTESGHKIPEKDKTIEVNDPLCPEKTLSRIDAMSPRVVANANENVDDFHMSVDEINISIHENVECTKVLHKSTDVLIVGKNYDLKKLVEDSKSSDHEKSTYHPIVDSENSTNKGVSNIESKSENVLSQVASTITSESNESCVNLNLEQKDCSVSICQNTQKNYLVDNQETKISDVSMTKGSEKRKSDSDMTKDSLNYPKKQKIVVPEVCLWLKEISIDKITTQSVDSSKLEQPEKSVSLNEDVDSQTYVISRGQLEHFAKIKEMNDDVHDRLNSSDHFIENVNMSLVDSSLDKSNEFKKCSRTNDDQDENEVDNHRSSELCNRREEIENNCETRSLDNKNIAMTQNILEESLRTSTETNQSFVCETKPTVVGQSKPTLRKIVEDYVSNLEMCDVVFENREIIFSLMDGHVLVKVSLSEDMSKDGDNTDIHIADISVEQKPSSSSGTMNALLDVASKMVLVELDTRSLKYSFVVSGDMVVMVEKCYQVTDKAWQWLKACYSLYVKYNLKLVDEYKWTFEICDGFHLCAWDIEIKLQSKRILHYAKSDNVRIKTSVGRSRITDSMFRDVLDSVTMGWSFLPDVVSKIHNLIIDTRHLASKR